MLENELNIEENYKYKDKIPLYKNVDKEYYNDKEKLTSKELKEFIDKKISEIKNENKKEKKFNPFEEQKTAAEKNEQKVMDDIESCLKNLRIHTVNVVNQLNKIRDISSFQESNGKLKLENCNKGYKYDKNYLNKLKNDTDFLSDSHLKNEYDFIYEDPFLINIAEYKKEEENEENDQNYEQNNNDDFNKTSKSKNNENSMKLKKNNLDEYENFKNSTNNNFFKSTKKKEIENYEDFSNTNFDKTKNTQIKNEPKEYKIIPMSNELKEMIEKCDFILQQNEIYNSINEDKEKTNEKIKMEKQTFKGLGFNYSKKNLAQELEKLKQTKEYDKLFFTTDKSSLPNFVNNPNLLLTKDSKFKNSKLKLTGIKSKNMLTKDENNRNQIPIMTSEELFKKMEDYEKKHLDESLIQKLEEEKKKEEEMRKKIKEEERRKKEEEELEEEERRLEEEERKQKEMKEIKEKMKNDFENNKEELEREKRENELKDELENELKEEEDEKKKKEEEERKKKEEEEEKKRKEEEEERKRKEEEEKKRKEEEEEKKRKEEEEEQKRKEEEEEQKRKEEEEKKKKEEKESFIGSDNNIAEDINNQKENNDNENQSKHSEKIEEEKVEEEDQINPSYPINLFNGNLNELKNKFSQYSNECPFTMMESFEFNDIKDLIFNGINPKFYFCTKKDNENEILGLISTSYSFNEDGKLVLNINHLSALANDSENSEDYIQNEILYNLFATIKNKPNEIIQIKLKFNKSSGKTEEKLDNLFKNNNFKIDDDNIEYEDEEIQLKKLYLETNNSDKINGGQISMDFKSILSLSKEKTEIIENLIFDKYLNTFNISLLFNYLKNDDYNINEDEIDNKILKDNYDEIKDKFYQNEISIENNQKNVDIESEINDNNKDLDYSILNSKLKLNLQSSISEKINGYIYNVICTKNAIKKDNIIVIPTNSPKMFVVISTKINDNKNNIYDDLYNDIKEIDFEEIYNNELVKIWIPSFDISSHLFSNKLTGFENIKITDKNQNENYVERYDEIFNVDFKNDDINKNIKFEKDENDIFIEDNFTFAIVNINLLKDYDIPAIMRLLVTKDNWKMK